VFLGPSSAHATRSLTICWFDVPRPAAPAPAAPGWSAAHSVPPPPWRPAPPAHHLLLSARSLSRRNGSDSSGTRSAGNGSAVLATVVRTPSAWRSVVAGTQPSGNVVPDGVVQHVHAQPLERHPVAGAPHIAQRRLDRDLSGSRSRLEEIDGVLHRSEQVGNLGDPEPAIGTDQRQQRLDQLLRLTLAYVLPSLPGSWDARVAIAPRCAGAVRALAKRSAPSWLREADRIGGARLPRGARPSRPLRCRSAVARCRPGGESAVLARSGRSPWGWRGLHTEQQPGEAVSPDC
jgi:hypothetical protein